LVKKLTYTLLVTMAAALAACSDSTTSPQIAAPATTAAVQGSTQDLTFSGVIQFSITINPSQNTTFYLGAGNSLYFPAGSLCSSSSTYGSGEWDKPCTKATSSVTVNVKAWLDAKGKPRVDFDKHIRFAPTNDPSKFVVIQFADLEAALDPFFNILYCPQVNSACVNEAKTDLSLLTVRNPLTGKVTRRIKHFSGYNVAAGEEGLFNLIDGGLSGMSLSVSDFKLNTVGDVRAAYGLSTEQAETMLDRITQARGNSGYILASGQQEMM
jgi:hypothetical protein